MAGFSDFVARVAAALKATDLLVVQGDETTDTTNKVELGEFLIWLKDQIESGSFDDTIDIFINSGTVPSASPFSGSHAGLRVARAGGGAVVPVVGEGSVGWEASRFSNDTGAGVFASLKARGTISSPAVVQTSDRLGQFSFYGWDGVDTYRLGAHLRVLVTAATPGPTDMRSRAVLEVTPAGSVTPSEAWTVDHYTGQRMYGSVVIDQNRHHQLRSYTVATLPSAATAGQMIYVSNETGGATPAFSDGTNWRRVTDRAIVS